MTTEKQKAAGERMRAENPYHDRNSEVCRDFIQGMSRKNIGEKYGISRPMVGIILYLYGVHASEARLKNKEDSGFGVRKKYLKFTP